MSRSSVQSQHSSCRGRRRVICCAFILATVALTGCGNSCFAGFSNNGNGGIIIKAGNPPPACSLPQVNGMMRVVALKSSICESCAVGVRLQHVFVTLRGIQLHSSATTDPHSPDWLELGPQLANEPRQIDLMGGSGPETLLRSAAIPAGIYRQVRLQFFPDAPEYVEEPLPQNVCGEARRSCVVMADGRVDELSWSDEVPELLIPAQAIEGGSLVVLPEATMELQLSFEARQEFYSSAYGRWKLQTVLGGHAEAVPQSLVNQSDLAAK